MGQRIAGVVAQLTDLSGGRRLGVGGQRGHQLKRSKCAQRDLGQRLCARKRQRRCHKQHAAQGIQQQMHPHRQDLPNAQFIAGYQTVAECSKSRDRQHLPHIGGPGHKAWQRDHLRRSDVI
jgi:hypothetical protein